MYDEILVPTDGSSAAETAIDHAVTIAEQFGATIHALYVVDASAYSTMEAGAEVVAEALESEGKLSVETVSEVAEAADVPVVESVVSGKIHPTISEYVDDEGIDLIVMGTHGREGIDRYLLGSVTERVVRTADPPVLTVREDDATTDDGE